MTIAVYSEKGGVGKTSISYSLAKDLEMKYITNDQSLSMLKMGNARLCNKKIPFQENTLYDFGGFKSEEAIDIISKVDLVLIPTICDMNSIAKALGTIKKILKKNKDTKIIVIGTMIEKYKEFSQIHQVISHHYPDIEMIPFRKTKLLKNSIEKGIGASSFFVKDNKNKSLYKNSFADYEKIKKKCEEII
jgi:cellulose biosynthesis protein BcsQ